MYVKPGQGQRSAGADSYSELKKKYFKANCIIRGGLELRSWPNWLLVVVTFGFSPGAHVHPEEGSVELGPRCLQVNA